MSFPIHIDWPHLPRPHIPPYRGPLLGTTVIRDRINIDGSFLRFLEHVAPGRTLTIVARLVEHDSTFNLDLNGVNLTIVASMYIGHGGGINRDGVNGQPGKAGNTGEDKKGTKAGNGTNGSPSGTISVLAETVSGLHISAKGGAGGAGGRGGPGRPGDNGRIFHKPNGPVFESEPTPGSAGGDGGSGGMGAQGGSVDISAVQFLSEPTVDISGGLGGTAGPGGQGGAWGRTIVGPGSGHPDEDDTSSTRAAAGRVGVQGISGQPGRYTKKILPTAQYWHDVVDLLGRANAEAWAQYRLSVADYYFRAYLPGPNSPHADDLKLAVEEYKAAPQCSPNLAIECTRQLTNISLGINVLGMQRDLDVVPDFDKYIGEFTSFGPLVLQLFATGVSQVLHAVDLQSLQALPMIDKQKAKDALASAKDSNSIAQTERQDVDDSIAELDQKVESVRQEIQGALAEMEHHGITFGQIVKAVGTVAQVATAVISVIGAIPTGGASLIALVPDVIALTKTITDVAPIVSAIFTSGSEDTLKKVKAEYGKVGKDVSTIIDSTKAVVSMVTLIENLAKGTTPDNSKYLALVKRGAELAHELMLQYRQRNLSEMRVAATENTIKRSQDLVELTTQIGDTINLTATTLRIAGLCVIKSAQLKVDILQGFAFEAQRSVEIYTLKDESATLHFDAGYIHPDVEADFREHFISDAQLIAAYTGSWSHIVQPIDLQQDYTSYWATEPAQSDIRRLSFTGSDVERFRQTLTLSFTLEPVELGMDRFDTKAQTVFCSFLGATSPSGVVTCEVRHGNRYSQQRRDGSRSDLYLKSRAMTLPSRTKPLELANVSIGTQPPLTTPQSLPFWGRGVCGRWEVSLPANESATHVVDLTNLAEIQVWIAYQFLARA
ncbi:hypothetical protein QFC22_003999 [Naganishia vaughanmartiniae]|uniref:Uncharacterized protein n=1 Tax=Naganishia vaughanmartiniae TaxID=1424756 RepID=A0ACC2X3D6_9TREE|nr:hypothetical protein QFC22_003999 [Naganishia vaughanmartiniae]